MAVLYQQTYTGDYNVSATYHIAGEPSNHEYLVVFSGSYIDQNGNPSEIDRRYSITYLGAQIVIPGWPADWYKYLALVITIAIALFIGKFGIEEGIVVMVAVSSVFFAMRWYYDIPGGEALMMTAIGIAWPIAFALVFMKGERTGLM
jgi:hypothetical protein